MSETISYSVRAVPRYEVVRDVSGPTSGGSWSKGTYGTEPEAYAAAYALCREEHERLGYPIDDERIRYPEPVQNTTVDLSEPHRRITAAEAKRIGRAGPDEPQATLDARTT